MDSKFKIAVTGTSGFIGQYVLAELVRTPNDIVVACRDKSLFSDLDSSVQFVTFDMADLPDNPYEKLGSPDALIHLAWEGLPNYKSLHHFETELPRQYQFLKSMVVNGLSNLLVTGTCFEYGMQSGALSESLNTTPDNPYGFAKDSLRKQLESLQKETFFNLTWARLFYMFGDGQAKNSLYSQFKDAVAKGDQEFNMSGGEQLRDYLHIKNVASLLTALSTNNQMNGVVNICSGKPVSVRKLVEGWVADENANIYLNLGYYPYPDYEPFAFWGDRQRLDNLLECE